MSLIWQKVQLYICAVGAAATVTIFDGVSNDASSALHKTGSWLLTRFTDGTQTTVCFVAALLLFCGFAALVTLAYKPRASREAFVLGMSVLAIVNASVKSPRDPRRIELLSSLSVIPLAHAQHGPATRESGIVWIGVRGIKPSALGESSLYVYDRSSNGRLVVNTKLQSGHRLELPLGDYFAEIRRAGYRSIFFPLTVERTASAVLPSLQPVDSDSLSNLFGPQSLSTKPNIDLGISLEAAFNACGASNSGGAHGALRRLSAAERSPFVEDPLLGRALCWPQ